MAKRTKFKSASKAAPVSMDNLAAAAASALAGARPSRLKGHPRLTTDGEGQKSIEEQKKMVLFYGDNGDREELKKELVRHA